MRGIRHRAALIFLACFLIAPARASALEPLTAPIPGPIVMRFGETYVVAGSLCTHRGLDIIGRAGDVVAAPCRGRVRFAGQVPADGGGRCGAVTVETGGGALVTVSPLQDVWVDAGMEVEPGTSVGELAPTGDASYGSPHVHLSVRIGGRYVDPEPLLAADVVRSVGGSVGAAEEEVGVRAQSSPRVGSSTADPAPTGDVVEVQGVSAGQVLRERVKREAGKTGPVGADIGIRAADVAVPAAQTEAVRQSVFRSIQAIRKASATVRRDARPVVAVRSGVERRPIMSPVSSIMWEVRGVWLWVVGGGVSLVAATRVRRKATAIERV